MNASSKDFLLLQTYVELDTQISHLTKRISADRHIEVGDDPGLVQELEKGLIKLQNKAKALEPYFDLETTPLSKANVYFRLLKHIRGTMEYLLEVRKRDYGSIQHTQQLLKKLSDCTNSVYAIGDLVTARTGLLQ